MDTIMMECHCDPFVQMYYLRKAIFLYEFAYGVYPKLRDMPIGCIEDADSFCDVMEQVTDHINAAIANVPMTKELQQFIAEHDCETLFEVVESCDFDIIVKAHHNSPYFNEIPLEEVMSFFIDEFERIWELDENGAYSVSVYDWGDYELYFANLEDLQSFVHNYDIAPYNVFKTENGVSECLWSE